jgi:hypothetical protein
VRDEAEPIEALDGGLIQSARAARAALEFAEVACRPHDDADAAAWARAADDRVGGAARAVPGMGALDVEPQADDEAAAIAAWALGAFVTTAAVAVPLARETGVLGARLDPEYFELECERGQWWAKACAELPS